MIKHIIDCLAIGFCICVIFDNVVRCDNYLEEVNAMTIPDVYIIEETEETEVIEVTEVTENYISLGTFTITAYCPCEKCCGKWGKDRTGKIVGSCGIELKEGVAIAVDPDIIPYYTHIFIDDVEYIALDCGGAINGNEIDIYFENHEDALNFGIQQREVFIYEKTN